MIVGYPARGVLARQTRWMRRPGEEAPKPSARLADRRCPCPQRFDEMRMTIQDRVQAVAARASDLAIVVVDDRMALRTCERYPEQGCGPGRAQRQLNNISLDE